MKLTLDFDELSISDLEDFKKACGLDILALDVNAIPTEALAPLIWILERQKDPHFTLEDARRIKLKDLERGDPPASGSLASSTNGSRPSQGSTATRRRN